MPPGLPSQGDFNKKKKLLYCSFSSETACLKAFLSNSTVYVTLFNFTEEEREREREKTASKYRMTYE